MPPARRPPKAGARTKVKDLDMPAKLAEKASPRVRELTIGDLNDLAARANGVSVQNDTLGELTADDVRSLEEVFQEAKISMASQVGSLAQQGIAEGDEGLEGELFDNWSCCCCTPCCCCAAADVDPFAEPAGAAPVR
jgi:hypothetical protein